jgi:DNA-directed RNA polymerase specialized sigma subunit
LAFDPASRRGVLIDAVRDYDHKAGRSLTGFADKMIEAELVRPRKTGDATLEAPA